MMEIFYPINRTLLYLMYSDSYDHSTIGQGVSLIGDDVGARFHLIGVLSPEKDNVHRQLP